MLELSPSVIANLQEVENCGFHSWVDEEWPDHLKTALAKIWAMYTKRNSAYIEEIYQSSKKMKELADEKGKIEKKHAGLLEEAHKWMDREKYVEALENEIEVLKNAKEQLKNVLKSQAEVFKNKQKKLLAGRDGLLEEKSK